MESIDINLHALSALVTIGLAFILFYVLWQKYVVDVTRQSLFELRDELFDLAANEKFDFNSKPYTTLRGMFNASIRFAHKFDVVNIAMLLAVSRRRRFLGHGAAEVQKIIESIPEMQTKEHVKQIMLRMHLVLAWHVYRRSLLLILLTPIVLVSLFNISIIQRTQRRFSILVNGMSYCETKA